MNASVTKISYYQLHHFHTSTVNQIG